MNTITLIMLLGATGISIFNMVMVIYTNYKFRDRMAEGGQKVVALADLTGGLGIVSVMGCIINIIMYIFEKDEASMLFLSIGLLISSLNVMLIMRFRGIQNQKLGDTLRRNEELLNERNKIMANVSHEIRTPMNTIIGTNEVLLNDDDMPSVFKEKLGNISEAGNSLLHVVNNLIDFTKIESKRLDILETNYNVRELIINIVDSSRNAIHEKNLDFKINIDNDIPSVLHGDEVRIMQVVSNILDNACKFTNKGIISLDIRAKKVSEDQVLLCFEIQDTGIGIPEHERRTVFNASMVNNSRDDHRQKGAGLGLLISKNIIDGMHGAISFETEVGTGTQFNITIPQAIIDATPIGELDGIKGCGKHYMFTAPGAKVLVVDDNIVNLFVAKEILEKYDIDVTTASSGQECLDIVNGNVYDIIFMDYVMPGMDGHETLVKIREQGSEYLNRVPVVALTAQALNGADKIYREEGFEDYLSKPLKVDELENVLLKLLPEKSIVHKDFGPGEELDLEGQQWFRRITSVLKDVDVRKGLSHCGNEYSAYMNLLRTIASDGDNQLAKLNTAFEQTNLDDYRIATHTMKSVTASAGAMSLSQFCKEHEDHARFNDVNYIRNHYQTLLDGYKNFLNRIETVLQREGEVKGRPKNPIRKNADSQVVKDLAAKLLDALDQYDVDEAEKLLTALDELSLKKECQQAVAQARNQLILFDYDKAAEAIKNAFEV
ncbi:MAG: response regulator [Lachnospiraceae bacterium]|nr:response regulator [Lachnospiraceae bacterium]